MEALNKEFLIIDRKSKVQAMIGKNSEVIRIRITNIPYEKDDKLKTLQIQLFEKYESILEIGLHHTVDGLMAKNMLLLSRLKQKVMNPLHLKFHLGNRVTTYILFGVI